MFTAIDQLLPGMWKPDIMASYIIRYVRVRKGFIIKSIHIDYDNEKDMLMFCRAFDIAYEFFHGTKPEWKTYE